MNENWVLLRRVNVISLFYICSECLGDVILHQKKKDIPPQIPNTIAFFPVYRWGSTVVIQNVSQKFIFQRHRNRRSIWKKIQSGRMETVSSKSCDQEWLFIKCQHLKKVLTVGVSSWESKTCAGRWGEWGISASAMARVLVLPAPALGLLRPVHPHPHPPPGPPPTPLLPRPLLQPHSWPSPCTASPPPSLFHKCS